MKKYLLATTAAGAALALAAPAHADNWYITGFGGINMVDDAPLSFHWHSYYDGDSTAYTVGSYTKVTKHSSVGYWTNFDGELEMDNGFVVGAAIGRECDCLPGWSFEAELAFRKNDFDAAGLISFGYYYQKYVTVYLTTVTGTSAVLFTGTKGFHEIKYKTTTAVGGDVTAFSIMANAWYEFDMDGSISPFVGAGIGWADVEYDVGDPADVSGSDSGIAWQVGAGISFDMSEKTALRIEYRYMEVPDLEILHDGVDLGIDSYEAQSVIVGFKVDF